MGQGGLLGEELDPRVYAERRLLALAVQFGQAHQSEQTGLVHLNPHEAEEGIHDTIPILYNFLFALALIRSKGVEQVQEAKELLKRLLAFQVESGGFPVHLHQYPECCDPWLGSRILGVFCEIWEGFHHVLGDELREKVTQSGNRLLGSLRHYHKDREGPWHQRFLFGGVCYRWGCIQGDDAVQNEGRELWATASSEWRDEEALFSERLGELFWVQAWMDEEGAKAWSRYYDGFRGVFVGPGHREYEWDEEPKPSFFDAQMAAQLGEVSQRLIKAGPHQLWGALVHSRWEFKAARDQMSGVAFGQDWMSTVEPSKTVALLGRKDRDPAAQRPGLHVMRIFWGSPERVHSWVCQVPEQTQVEWHREGDHLRLDFFLQAKEFDERDRHVREVAFYIDKHEPLSLTLAGKSLTTFQLGQELEINSSGLQASWEATLVEGEASFVGHVMPGNRPSQQHSKGSARFEAHDWQIFLRTLQRSGPCHVRVEIRLREE